MDEIETAEQQAQRRRKEGLAWSTFFLLVVGCFSAGFGALMTMASDGCRSSSERPICATEIQHLVTVLPAAGLVAGLLVSVIGGGYAVRHDKSPGGWLCTAWVLLIGAILASFGIATA